jgi:hypothetical protein
VATVGCGCSKKGSDPPPEDKDAQLRTQLVGDWVRQWELGPVVYQRALKGDGSLVMREFRAAPGTGTSAPTGNPTRSRETAYHRHYKVHLPLYQELTGTWSARGGSVTYCVLLPNGDPLLMSYKIERLTATELVESTTGLEGKTQITYQRMK